MSFINRYLLSTISFCILFQCSSSKENNNSIFKEYKYQQDLSLYLSSAFQFNINTIDYLLVIPVNSCSSCITAAFELAENQNDNPHFYTLIWGRSAKDLNDFKILISKLSEAKLLIDLESKYTNFDTGVFGPTIVDIKRNKIASLDLSNIKFLNIEQP
jgi:hypothetical protein